MNNHKIRPISSNITIMRKNKTRQLQKMPGVQIPPNNVVSLITETVGHSQHTFMLTSPKCKPRFCYVICKKLKIVILSLFTFFIY